MDKADRRTKSKSIRFCKGIETKLAHRYINGYTEKSIRKPYLNTK